MNTIIIDGKVASERLCRSIADEVTNFRDKHGIRPGLAVVFVGNDSASEVYVRTKARQTNAVGMLSFTHRLPTETSQDELLKLLHLLNTDPEIDGILVQLPLPAHIDVQLVIAAIQPDKDVDGFHPINAGLVMTGGGGIVPCTPLACLKLIKSIRTDLAGLNALVVGCSNIVGKPMAQLLLAEHCTVTSAHVKTRNSSELCRQADILVVAVGRPGLVRGDWIKPGASRDAMSAVQPKARFMPRRFTARRGSAQGPRRALNAVRADRISPFSGQFSVGAHTAIKDTTPAASGAGRVGAYLARSFADALAIGTNALVTNSSIGGALVISPWSTKVLI
jgi:methylenetetrahydrofolate dehydrogenase (NADP+) / methenyltetrahydrofolate cyclohydrolase